MCDAGRQSGGLGREPAASASLWAWPAARVDG